MLQMPDPRSALVVDDNATNRLLASTLLKRAGWQIEESDNGEKAVRMVEARRYDLILLDISMPGMSGEEACVLMRKLPDGASLRIIAYTAHAFPDEKARILSAGFNDVLIKPVSLQALAEAIA